MLTLKGACRFTNDESLLDLFFCLCLTKKKVYKGRCKFYQNDSLYEEIHIVVIRLF